MCLQARLQAPSRIPGFRLYENTLKPRGRSYVCGIHPLEATPASTSESSSSADLAVLQALTSDDLEVQVNTVAS